MNASAGQRLSTSGIVTKSRPGADIAATAHAIMAANPCLSGWRRVQSRPCSSRHSPTPGARPLLLWRRNRDMFGPDYRLLDPADDPPLWVAEHVSTALCITDHWVWMHRNILNSDSVREDVGQPWQISGVAETAQPGLTVSLSVENGRWVWVLTDERSAWCGGYVARWAD